MLASRGQEDSADQDQPKSVVRIVISNVQRPRRRYAITRDAELLAPAPTHPDPLVGPTLRADASPYICSVGAVPKGAASLATGRCGLSA
jgi:hypothetical protein